MKRFSRRFGSLSLWLFTACVLLNLAAACGAEWYVATNGDDHWSGRLAAPNADRSDGPLASLTAARDAVRRARAAGAAAEAMTVCVRGGVYRLDRPLALSRSTRHGRGPAGDRGLRPGAAGAQRRAAAGRLSRQRPALGDGDPRGPKGAVVLPPVVRRRRRRARPGRRSRAITGWRS